MHTPFKVLQVHSCVTNFVELLESITTSERELVYSEDIIELLFTSLLSCESRFNFCHFQQMPLTNLLSYRNNKQQTFLHVAQNHLNVCRHILQCAPQLVHERDCTGQTPINQPLISHNYLHELANSKADFNSLDNNGMTVWMKNPELMLPYVDKINSELRDVHGNNITHFVKDLRGFEDFAHLLYHPNNNGNIPIIHTIERANPLEVAHISKLIPKFWTTPICETMPNPLEHLFDNGKLKEFVELLQICKTVRTYHGEMTLLHKIVVNNDANFIEKCLDASIVKKLINLPAMVEGVPTTPLMMLLQSSCKNELVFKRMMDLGARAVDSWDYAQFFVWNPKCFPFFANMPYTKQGIMNGLQHIASWLEGDVFWQLLDRIEQEKPEPTWLEMLCKSNLIVDLVHEGILHALDYLVTKYGYKHPKMEYLALAQSPNGNSILHALANVCEEPKYIAKMMKGVCKRFPALLNAKNQDGNTALHMAALYPLYKKLVALGADCTIKNNTGQVPTVPKKRKRYGETCDVEQPIRKRRKQ